MDPMLRHDENIKRRIRYEWVRWRNHKRYYPDVTMWWERYVKKQLRHLIRQEDSKHNKGHRLMENHLYGCIYDILRSDAPETENLPALRRYKAKIVRLHASRMKKVLLDNNAQDKIDGEEPTLFHILKMINRRETWAIHQVQDLQRNIITRPQDIINTFVTHLRQTYGPIALDTTCISILENIIQPTCPMKYSNQLEQPITCEEILTAMRAGARHRAPGTGGISLEFHTSKWETIKTEIHNLLNQISLHKNITPLPPTETRDHSLPSKVQW